MRTPATEAMWAAFKAAHPTDETEYDVVAFGSSPAMADALAQLVLRGPKRATAALLRDFGEGGEPMPRLGGHVVFVGGDDTPLRHLADHRPPDRAAVVGGRGLCLGRGRGDRTREDWLAIHRTFFARQAAAEGFAPTDDAPTVFERFALV